MPLKFGSNWRSSDRMTEFLKFLHVGLLTNIVYFSVLALLRFAWDAPLWLDAAAAYFCSALFNYALHYRFTFKSTERHRTAILRYIALQTGALTLNSTILQALVVDLGLHYVIGQGVAIAVVTGLTFLINRRWVFSPARECRHS